MTRSALIKTRDLNGRPVALMLDRHRSAGWALRIFTDPEGDSELAASAYLSDADAQALAGPGCGPPERDGTANLLDVLRERGYWPHEPARDGQGYVYEAFDLTVSGTGTVRVLIWPGDERADVILFDAQMTVKWDARFAVGVPDATIVAAMSAAENVLAAQRGGPVTPAGS